MPANQFPAAGLAVDFCQQSYPLDARPGREIASKKDCRYQRHGGQTITVTQSLADFGRYSYKPRPAFQDWIERLKTGERLPRGRYFVGKKPGGRMVFIDELGGTWTEKVTVIHTNAG
ncbi:TPA: hypothetical protein ACULF1_004281 [Escherichia coli]|nr:hypothetical protein [Escherichia coli]MDL7760053.1 hypothetical protein [Escherichia coli]